MLTTFQFLNHCRSHINRIIQQKLALPISPTLDSYNGSQLIVQTQQITAILSHIFTSPEAQDTRSSEILTGVSVHLTDYKLSCDKLAFYSRPFKNIEFCLNRACTALAILICREMLHLFTTNKGIYTKIVDRHITKRQAQSSQVCSIN